MPSPGKVDLALRRARDRAALDSGACLSMDDDDDDPFMPPAFVRWSLEEHVRNLIEAYELIERSQAFFARYAPAFQDLQNAPAMNRLGGLAQLGIKRFPAMNQYALHGNALIHVSTTPYLHARLLHSRLVAAHAIALGLSLGDPFEDVATAAFGALLHDVGHSAFSHDGDTILVAHGRPSHEERGVALVRADPDIAESFALAGVETESVVAVMEEYGDLGARQSVMDTLAYVALDAVMSGSPLPDAFSRDAIRSIKGVADGRLLVDDPAPLSRVLHERARLSQDIYFSPNNKLATVALQTVMEELVRLGLISLDDIEHGTDIDLGMTCHIAVRRTEALRATWLPSAIDIAHGFFDRTSEWETIITPSQERARTFLRGEHLVAPEPGAMLIAPFDFTKKTLRVRLPDGSDQTLKAPDSFLRREDKEWIALRYRG